MSLDTFYMMICWHLMICRLIKCTIFCYLMSNVKWKTLLLFFFCTRVQYRYLYKRFPSKSFSHTRGDLTDHLPRTVDLLCTRGLTYIYNSALLCWRWLATSTFIPRSGWFINFPVEEILQLVFLKPVIFWNQVFWKIWRDFQRNPESMQSSDVFWVCQEDRILLT